MFDDLKTLTQWTLAGLAAFTGVSLVSVAMGFASLSYWGDTVQILGGIFLTWVAVVLGGAWLFNQALLAYHRWVEPRGGFVHNGGSADGGSADGMALMRALTRALGHSRSIRLICIIDGELVEVKPEFYDKESSRGVDSALCLLTEQLALSIRQTIDQRELLSAVESAARQQAARREAAKPIMVPEEY